LRLSQKKLSEMAGVQRRQLSTLEKGGNVTLSTLRKVIAQLPNLESFTIDAVRTDVTRKPAENEEYFAETIELLWRVVTDLAMSGLLGKEGLTPEQVELIREANFRVYGHRRTPAQVDKMTEQLVRKVEETGDPIPVYEWRKRASVKTLERYARVMKKRGKADGEEP
jgi:transcriptional regulator with XRE-family HTH domain